MSIEATSARPPAVHTAVGELVRHLASAEAAGDPADRLALARLARSLQCYECELTRFVARQRRRPPTELGGVLRRVFQVLSAVAIAGPAGLRLQALESRFHAAERLFAQRLEAREARERAAAAQPSAS